MFDEVSLNNYGMYTVYDRSMCLCVMAADLRCSH